MILIRQPYPRPSVRLIFGLENTRPQLQDRRIGPAIYDPLCPVSLEGILGVSPMRPDHPVSAAALIRPRTARVLQRPAERSD